MSDSNKSFGEKISTVIAIIVGLFAGARIINQGEAAKKLPRLWRSIRGIAGLKALQFVDMATGVKSVAYRWLMSLSRFIRWMAFIAVLLILGGVLVKAELHSNIGHVLVAVGTMTFAALGLTLYMLSDGIAVIAYKGFKTFGNMFGKAAAKVGVTVPEVMSAEELKEFRESVRHIMTVVSVMAFTLLFTMFFPAWSTLGWTTVFWAMAAVMLCIAVAANKPIGKAMIVLFYAMTVLLGGTAFIFIIDRLSGGALGFTGFQEWFRNINHSEILTALLLIVIPMTMLGLTVMSKDKDTKAGLFYATKWVFLLCVLLFLALLYKGTISWNQLTGKNAPQAVTKTIGWVEGSPPNQSESQAGSVVAPVPQTTGSTGAVYLPPPPTGSFDPPPVYTDPPPVLRTRPLRLRNRPLPPLKEIEYDDALSADDGLDSIE